MASDARTGDVGAAIRMQVKDQDGAAVAVGDATAVLFRFLKPDGATVVEKAGSVEGDGTAGWVRYVTEPGFLDQAGTWRYEVNVEWGGGAVDLTTDDVKFKVDPVLGEG